MSMHLCAVAPNVRIMEIDVDQAPWVDELVTVKPDIRDGTSICPRGQAGAPRSTKRRSGHTRQAGRERGLASSRRALTKRPDASSPEVRRTLTRRRLQRGLYLSAPAPASDAAHARVERRRPVPLETPPPPLTCEGSEGRPFTSRPASAADMRGSRGEPSAADRRPPASACDGRPRQTTQAVAAVAAAAGG